MAHVQRRLRTTSLEDVSQTAPTTGQALVYSATSGLWVPADVATQAELDAAVAPLASDSDVAAAVADLASDADLAAAVAPLASDAELASAVAPLATLLGLGRTIWRPAIGAIGSSVSSGTFAYLAGGILSQLFSQNSGTAAFYFDPAEHAVAGYTTKLRLRFGYMTNLVNPGVTFTLKLYPVTPGGGGSGAVSLAAALPVTGADVALTPTAGSEAARGSAEIDAPAAGRYALGVVTSGTTAASSTTVLPASIEVRNVPA